MSLTVTFQNIDNPRRSLADLQLLLVFCHLSAHSSRANSQAAYMRMIDYLDNYVGGAGKTPFEIVREIIRKGDLDNFVRQGVGLGRTGNHKRFFESAVNSSVDLRTVGRDELAHEVSGVGPAKASLFVMFRDRNWQGAVLDTEVQKWMRDEFNALGRQDKAREIPVEPLRTEAQYKKVESVFLELARAKKAEPRSLMLDVMQRVSDRTAFDEADEKRIEQGGKRFASHWDSRISRNEISLVI